MNMFLVTFDLLWDLQTKPMHLLNACLVLFTVTVLRKKINAFVSLKSPILLIITTGELWLQQNVTNICIFSKPCSSVTFVLGVVFVLLVFKKSTLQFYPLVDNIIFPLSSLTNKIQQNLTDLFPITVVAEKCILCKNPTYKPIMAPDDLWHLQQAINM